VCIMCSPANGMQQKMYNWNTLQQKVLKRLGVATTKEELEDICNCKPGAIERLLKLVKVQVEVYQGEPEDKPK
jgi:hypothetical protein